MAHGFACCCLLLCAAAASAHEIPGSVRVQVYLAPSDDALTALFRVPLQAMRDIDFARHPAGNLDLDRLQPQLSDAAMLWLADDFRIIAAGRPLPRPELVAARIALPNDPAFVDYPAAREAVRNERLAPDTRIYSEQALLDVEFRYPGVTAAAGELMIEPTLARLGLRTVTQVRFVAADGEVKTFAFIGDPGQVSLVPSGWRVFRTFGLDGLEHVLTGADHLLFLLVLIIPLRRIRPLIVVVTAFTLAHSLTLIATLFGVIPRGLWFVPLVETLIAGSIVYMAFENLLRPELRRRWLVAYGFGLVHGFGFSFALHDTLQFAGDHIVLSLLAFNVGIEVGQLLVLMLAVPLLSWLATRVPSRLLTIVCSALIAHTSWHWLIERGGTLSEYSFTAPEWTTATLLFGLRWLTLVLVAALVVWLVRQAFDRWSLWRQEGYSAV